MSEHQVDSHSFRRARAHAWKDVALLALVNALARGDRNERVLTNPDEKRQHGTTTNRQKNKNNSSAQRYNPSVLILLSVCIITGQNTMR